MMVSKVARKPFTPPEKARRYWIGLKISPAEREDAWEMFHVVAHYGGVEVDDCCFSFPTEERWLAALEALRLRCGPEFFEAVESTAAHHGRGEFAKSE